MKRYLWIKVEKEVLGALKRLKRNDLGEAKDLLVNAENTLVELTKHPLSLEEVEELAKLERNVSQVLEALDWDEIEEARAILANLGGDVRAVVNHVLFSEEMEGEEEEGG